MFIHKSTAKPYQFGFVYLGRGFYLTVDPIGDIVSLINSILYRFGKIIVDKSVVIDSSFGSKRPPRALYLIYNFGRFMMELRLTARWDDYYRCRLKIPRFFYRLEQKRFNKN